MICSKTFSTPTLTVFYDRFTTYTAASQQGAIQMFTYLVYAVTLDFMALNMQHYNKENFKYEPN